MPALLLMPRPSCPGEAAAKLATNSAFCFRARAPPAPQATYYCEQTALLFARGSDVEQTQAALDK